MLIATVLWWLSAHPAFPVFLDIFHGMGRGSPLIAHTMPWSAIAFSTLLAGALFFAALSVLRAREY